MVRDRIIKDDADFLWPFKPGHQAIDDIAHHLCLQQRAAAKAMMIKTSLCIGKGGIETLH